MKRTLTLRREALAELGSADLANVHGAAAALPTSPLDDCINSGIAKFCVTDGGQRSRCICPTE